MEILIQDKKSVFVYTFGAASRCREFASLRNRCYRVSRLRDRVAISGAKYVACARDTADISAVDLVQVDVRACAAREGTSRAAITSPIQPTFNQRLISVSHPTLIVSPAIFDHREDCRVSAMPTDTLKDSRVLQGIIVHPLR